MKAERMIVTTTDTVPGWELDSVLGPICAHVVAGTGFISDFGAGISDVFGGRSGGYQKQLEAITEEAISALSEKALALGADCVIGLRTDQDEISGKGKQMFMVTATGTAVKARKLERAGTEMGDSLWAVSAQDLDTGCELRLLMASVKDNPEARLNEVQRAVLLRTRNSSIGPALLRSYDIRLQRFPDADWVGSDTLFLHRYFRVLDRTAAIEIIYYGIATYSSLRAELSSMVVENLLFDFRSISRLLEHADFGVRRTALGLCLAFQPTYVAQDVESLMLLAEKVRSAFPCRAQRVEEKGLLSRSVREKWLCECGTRFDTESDRCTTCGRDLCGFYCNELTPASVIESLRQRSTTLGAVLRG